MNNSVQTVLKDLCSNTWKSPHEYKTILDIAYMLGSCIGGATFHFIGAKWGLRFSLGFAIFTSFIGSSIGIGWHQYSRGFIWSVSFNAIKLNCIYLVPQVVSGVKTCHWVWRDKLLLHGLAVIRGDCEERRRVITVWHHLLQHGGQLPLNCFCPGGSQQ